MIPKMRLICRRCGARMEVARRLPRLGPTLPEVFPFQCIDCGHAIMAERPEPEPE